MARSNLTIMHARFHAGIKKKVSWLRSFWVLKTRSLFFRAAFMAIALVLGGLVVRLALLGPVVLSQLEQISASRQLSIAEYVARDISENISQRLTIISRVAASVPVEILSTPRDAEEWLGRRQKILPVFSRGLILIPVEGGGAVVDYPAIAGRRQLDFSHQDWFVKAIQTGQPTMGNPMRSPLDREPVLVVAAPVYDGAGRAVAVLAGITALDGPEFLKALQQTKIGENGGFLLVSPKDKMFIAATDSGKLFQPLPEPGVNPLHDRAMDGFRGTGVTVNNRGVEELSAVVSVPDSDWFLVARVPTQEIYQPLQRIKANMMGYTGGYSFAVLCAIILLFHHHFGPLRSASRQIFRMAQGEIGLQKVPVKLDDEVGELIKGFNFLVSRLEETTEQKLASERERVREKERIEILLRQWMADTSHELRTPISVLRAQIEAIQDGIHAANEKTLNVLHREVVGLSHLVDDLHTLALSDVQQFRGQMVPVDPVEVLDDAVQAFADRFQSAGLKIRLSDGLEPGLLTYFDPSHLRRLYSNLLENTLRYTDRGGELAIAANVDGDRLTILFDDTAPGVPAEALPHLFERFYRVDASRSREFGGSGIGLAVCLAIVEAYGGTIRAMDSPLEGVRIILQLKLMRDE